MDKKLEEYLSVPTHTRRSKVCMYSKELHYERNLKVFRSSTVMTRIIWASSKVVVINEQHIDKF